MPTVYLSQEMREVHNLVGRMEILPILADGGTQHLWFPSLMN